MLRIFIGSDAEVAKVKTDGFDSNISFSLEDVVEIVETSEVAGGDAILVVSLLKIVFVIGESTV